MDGSARGCGGSYGYGNDGRANHGGGGGASATATTATNTTAGPCGACKFLRRKCIKGCVFAAYFEADDVGTAQFAAVHRVFGASNASKLLLRLPPHRRLEAVVTLCYEALSRLRDPVYGCVAHIFALQQQVVNLQAELAYIQARLTTFQRIPSHQFPTTNKTLNPQIDNHDRLHNLVGDTTSFGPESTGAQQQQLQQELHYYSESSSAEMGASFTDMEDGEGGDEIQALMWELVTNYFPPSDKYRPSDD